MVAEVGPPARPAVAGLAMGCCWGGGRGGVPASAAMGAAGCGRGDGVEWALHEGPQRTKAALRLGAPAAGVMEWRPGPWPPPWRQGMAWWPLMLRGR